MASITLDNVSIHFPLFHTGGRSLRKTLLSVTTKKNFASDRHGLYVRALDGVSLQVDHGDRVGIVGRNGAGKTTLLRVIAGIYEPVAGRVAVEGAVNALLDVNLGLSLDATGYENIILRGLYLGMHPSEIRALAPGIAAFSELGEFLHFPARTYSTGMFLRLAFSIVTATKPELLLMDEWLMAGDAHFLAKAAERIDGFIGQSKILVLASHSLEIIRKWCNRVIWLEAGRIVMAGEPSAVLDRYSQAT